MAVAVVGDLAGTIGMELSMIEFKFLEMDADKEHRCAVCPGMAIIQKRCM